MSKRAISDVCLFAALLVSASLLAQNQPQKFTWNPSQATEIDIDQTLSSASFSAEQKKQISRIIRQQILAVYLNPAVKNTWKASDFKETFRDIPSHMRVAQLDVDGDGQKELVIQGLGTETCGGVGNCFFLILKLQDGYYHPILAMSAESFQVRKSWNGTLEIVLAGHDSAAEKALSLYVLCDGRFREAASYLYQTADGITELPSPEITLVKSYGTPCTLAKQ